MTDFHPLVKKEKQKKKVKLPIPASPPNWIDITPDRKPLEE